MTTRIRKIWRLCKHNELVASVNTSVIARIQHIYSTERKPKVPILNVLHPIYNTHVSDSEWEIICLDIIKNIEDKMPGVDVKDIYVSKGQPTYNCIHINIQVPDDYWVDTYDERV